MDSRTFEGMCAEADKWVASGRSRIGKRSVPAYAATRARTVFLRALVADEDMAECQRIGGLGGIVVAKRVERDAWLLKLTIRTMRNQGQPYYHV